MKIRIGNDFDISWSITRAGQPESFNADMPCTVLVINSTCSWIKFEPKFHIVENVVKFRVPADKQQPGKYKLLLQYKKKDLISEQSYCTYTTDVCCAFEIVLDSCDENLHEGDVSLTSDVKIWSDGKDGLNAYQLATLVEGYEGTVEDYLQDIRRPALDAAEIAGVAIRNLKIIEANVSENEELRNTAESRRNSAEQGRQTAETTRNQTFSEKITECSSITQEATTQANYAKAQGEEAATIIAQAGADPMLGKATTMQTTSTARSNCNLYDFQKGVTYAVAFVPHNSPGIYSQLILDCTSYPGLTSTKYSNFFVLEASRNYGIGVIPSNYKNGNYFYFTKNLTVNNKLNLVVLKIWGNSVAVSLNGSSFDIKTFDENLAVNFPNNHMYGFSPVIIDESSLETGLKAKINSVREFPFLLTDAHKDALWNNGRPDLVVLDDRLNNNYPVLPFESSHMNSGSKTDIPGGWKFTGYVDAMFQFSGWAEAPERYVLISFKYKASHSFTAENYQAGSDKIPYTFEPSAEYKEVRCLTTLGKETYNRFEIKLTGVTDLETAFLEVIDFEYENAICSGEYLASGFRKNRLIDTSRLKRDIVITGSEIELQYNPLYEDIIYRKTAPNEIPQFIGQRWFNSSAKQWFVASGTTGVSDWVTNSGAAAMAYRISTDENNKVTGIENIYDDTPVTLAIRSNVYVVTELPTANPIGYVFDGQTWTDPFINPT